MKFNKNKEDADIVTGYGNLVQNFTPKIREGYKKQSKIGKSIFIILAVIVSIAIIILLWKPWLFLK